MKLYFSNLLLLVFVTVPALAVVQGDPSRAVASIERYVLNVDIDQERNLLEGDAHLELLALKDSISSIRFSFAPSMTIFSVHDSADRKIEVREEFAAADTLRKELVVPIQKMLNRGDTLVLDILYEKILDTVSTLSSFIAGRELLLSSSEGASWWPILSDATNPWPDQIASVELHATLPLGFTPVSNEEQDSVAFAGSKATWKFVYKKPMHLLNCFFLCASSDFVKKRISSNDSTLHFSLYYNPARFSNEFADAVLHQLADAYSFFSSMLSPHHDHSEIRMVVIGSDSGNTDWSLSGGTIVGKNSLAYGAADSTALPIGGKNRWVHELGRLFRIATAESTLWLDESWPKYLATKFFLSKAENDPEVQRNERLELLSTTLDFYPARPLGEGRIPQKNEQVMFSSKGAYILLMLEYMIGEEAFAAVVEELTKNSGETPVSIPAFQKLCEEAYGSSLAWFFKEWINQTGFPELILSTDINQTNRGNYSLKATITQRGDVFTTPVDIVFSNNIRSITKRVFVEKQDQEFEFVLPFLPTKSELDPNYYLLRWVPRLRLLAHARTAASFRVFDRDLVNSEREATVMLQLDPNNLTGWSNIALFSLGKSAVLKGELAKAEEYFRRSYALEAREPAQLYSVLSLVRLGNVLEMEGRRDEAVELYKLGVTLARRNAAVYNVALTEAQKYLRQKFVSSDEFWYGEY